jgi:cytochrome c oxidase cbb3-type subunit 4
MDINILRSIFTVVIFVAFIAIWVWAWSKKRKTEFDEAANLPFADDEPHQLSKGETK